ncbi:alpha-(1,3)-fucosyltransferase C-like [Daphnia pulicaria]|uniref:alpha-(1,3)-fucosyltransferase C-like n=1 Tax=Daphnia pulicaria TaxID=35523 RepID=UPI001EEC533D|nr:alpha-(1,3)-fucosyltransferase C-like [Daphnia pulicaria]
MAKKISKPLQESQLRNKTKTIAWMVSHCKTHGQREKYVEELRKYMDVDIYGADYTQHAPPHSYIDALKYKPKELAAYLKILDADNALYNEYFWWKDHYRVEFISEYTSRHGFCGLCQKLHDIQTQFKSFADQRVISDLGDDSKCQPIDPNLVA